MNVLCKRVLRESLLGLCRAQPKMSRKRLLKTSDRVSCKADLGHWNGKIIVDGMDRINVQKNRLAAICGAADCSCV